MVSKKIRALLLDKDIKLGDFAQKINSSQPNLSQKLKRDNFTEKEICNMADQLGCDVEIILRDRNTGKEY